MTGHEWCHLTPSHKIRTTWWAKDWYKFQRPCECSDKTQKSFYQFLPSEVCWVIIIVLVRLLGWGRGVNSLLLKPRGWSLIPSPHRRIGEKKWQKLCPLIITHVSWPVQALTHTHTNKQIIFQCVWSGSCPMDGFFPSFERLCLWAPSTHTSSTNRERWRTLGHLPGAAICYLPRSLPLGS